MANDQANSAVLAALTPICVAQSAADPRAEKLAELAAITSNTQRQTYVLEAGWATMPLQATGAPNRQLATACAAALKVPAA